MKFVDITKRAAKNLRHAKIRTLLTALAIGVGAFTLTLTMAASSGAKAFIDRIINDNFDPAELIVAKDEAILSGNTSSKPREYNESFGTSSSSSGATVQVRRLSQDDVAKIRKTEGVETVREEVSVSAAYITRAGQKKYVANLQTFSPAQKPELLAGSVPRSLSSNQILMPEAFLSALGFKTPKAAIGQTITVAVRKSIDPSQLAEQLAQGISPEHLSAQSEQQSLMTEQLEIAAVTKKPTTAQPGTELYIFIGRDDALRLNEITTKGTSDFQKYPYVFAKVHGGKDEAKLKTTQDKLKNMGYITQSVQETQKFLLQFINILQGIVAGFAFLAVIASVFGVINTQYISVLERTQQIGLMKALGMRRRDIAWLFRLEAAWIGFLGGALGAGVAFILGTALNPWITEKLQLGDGRRLLIFEPIPIVVVVFGLMLVAIVAGILPARKAGKLDPVEALRTE